MGKAAKKAYFSSIANALGVSAGAFQNWAKTSGKVPGDLAWIAYGDDADAKGALVAEFLAAL